MNPISHPACNALLVKPAEITDENIIDLHVMKTESSVTSFWLPSSKEREAIALGQPIVFTCQGTTHPPISLGVLDYETKPASKQVIDRVKEIAESYIEAAFPSMQLPPIQVIELKLAIYGGMIAMMSEFCAITDRCDDDANRSAIEVQSYRDAILDRALRLNEARDQK